ncbi:hypothetical protein [Nannocystis sp. SCPEA4]|uniref:hypothetical protein n=1 Tax=Nannocystis sp. SCPEA4 TaxID=2996787 RepID=UPI00226F5893|nr:hypothetical protein [Nannocystis sp. SCPEA4]MCY1054887.1 hypothetical protein [Nannocystis sp. SCPEA4]
MPLMHRFTILSSLCLVLAACPANGGTTTDGGSTEPANTTDGPATDSTPGTTDDSTTSSTAPTTSSTGEPTTTESTTDATTDATTGAVECEPVTAQIGPDGGELSLCGATLRVPAGAVAADVEFGIAVVEPPTEPPFEQVFASPVFEFTASADAFTQPIELILPHEPTEDRLALSLYDELSNEFWIIEACKVTDTTISQSVFQLGIFAALRGTYPYPDSTNGLGGGTIELELLGMPASFSLDDPGNFGIYSDAEDGSRALTLKAIREIDGGVESLRIDFGVDAAGETATLTAVEWLSTVTSEGYTYIADLIGSDGVITLDLVDGDHYVGELSAVTFGGNPQHDEMLHATFDVTVEKFAFPPELGCFGGE